MRFLLYTKIGEATVKQSLGLPEYSYYFVYKEFKTVFEALGETVSVNTETEIRQHYLAAVDEGVDCVVVFFCPPHVAPDVYPFNAFCVVAWEFDSIPTETWDDDSRNDWRYVLNRQLGLICLSSHTRRVIERTMGEDFLVSDIPVPVWDRFENFPVSKKGVETSKSLHLEISGNVIDSWNYRLEAGSFEYIASAPSLQISNWDGKEIELDFTHDHLDSAYLGGFYLPEYWGSWSRLEHPWLMLPVQLQGDFDVELQTRGFGPSVGKSISIAFGESKKDFLLSGDLAIHHFNFTNVAACSLVRFSGFDMSPHDYQEDPRSMVLGLERIKITRAGEFRAVQSLTATDIRLDVEGVVYTTVFNPVDARKNWELIVTAFCYAFSDRPDTTLILKVTHQSVTSIMGRLHYLLQRIGPVACRVIAIHGFLPDDNFNRLIDGTHYYVNASSCEGLCLPMMEFMACGIPSVAPDHTAMQDYSGSDCSFIVNSSLEPAIWPHDPRQYKRARSYRIDWSSLVEQLKHSHECFIDDTAEYRRRSELSRNRVKGFSNRSRVSDRVVQFLDRAKLQKCEQAKKS